MTPHQVFFLIVGVLALIIYSVNLARLDQDKADQKLPIQLFLGSAVLLLACLFVAPSYVHLVAIVSAILMVVAAILIIPHDKGHGAVMIAFAVMFLLPFLSKKFSPRSDQTISDTEQRIRTVMAMAGVTMDPAERDRIRTAIANGQIRPSRFIDEDNKGMTSAPPPGAIDRIIASHARTNARSMMTPFVDEDGTVLSGLRRRHPPRWDVSSQ